MALIHADPATPIDVRPFGEHLGEHSTQALFKSAQLQVVRVVLKAGERLAPHSVAGEITVQCIEGCIELSADERSVRLDAGHMAWLAARCVHGITALSDASALVTIALHG
jgi:quercetin dioxygenase-like cupin family protein